MRILQLSAILLLFGLWFNSTNAYSASNEGMTMADDELGIDFSDEFEPKEKPEEENPFGLHFRGFLDTRWGTRLNHDRHFNRQTTLAETRLQGQIKFNLSQFKFNFKADLVHDDIIDGTSIDVREAYVELPSNEYLQVRLGRQNILWGLGDLIAINDVFPKDFMGLYYGRDAEAEYMVNSSDGIRSSLFFPNSTLDLVYVQFVPWDIPTGERFSYFNPFLNQTSGEQNPLNIQPSSQAALMARWSKTLYGQEFSLYFNRSRWQSPEGISAHNNQLYYPRLNTYGVSVRGEAGPGILSFDGAYYDSIEDKNGDNFAVRNSEIRYLLRYELELAQDLTASFQWNRESRLDQSNYTNALPDGMTAKTRHYDLLTLRLNQFLLSQKMRLSLFWFYSPSDNDSYLRLNLFHKFDDHWMINVGTNHFNGGIDDRFGQLQGNANAFVAIRYSF